STPCPARRSSELRQSSPCAAITAARAARRSLKKGARGGNMVSPAGASRRRVTSGVCSHESRGGRRPPARVHRPVRDGRAQLVPRSEERRVGREGAGVRWWSLPLAVNPRWGRGRRGRARRGAPKRGARGGKTWLPRRERAEGE